MRSESKSSNQEDNGRYEGPSDSSGGPKLEWQFIKPEENKPIYLEDMFGPVLYKINRLIGAEKKLFDKYVSRR